MRSLFLRKNDAIDDIAINILAKENYIWFSEWRYCDWRSCERRYCDQYFAKEDTAINIFAKGDVAANIFCERRLRSNLENEDIAVDIFPKKHCNWFSEGRCCDWWSWEIRYCIQYFAKEDTTSDIFAKQDIAANTFANEEYDQI